MRHLGFAKQALEVAGDGAASSYADDSYAGSGTSAPTKLLGYRQALPRRDQGDNPVKRVVKGKGGLARRRTTLSGLSGRGLGGALGASGGAFHRPGVDSVS